MERRRERGDSGHQLKLTMIPKTVGMDSRTLGPEDDGAYFCLQNQLEGGGQLEVMVVFSARLGVAEKRDRVS